PTGRTVAGVARMDPERPNLERLEGALVLGHPVDVGQFLPLPIPVDRRHDPGLVALAEDLDAPRPVARYFVAGGDEADLGQRFQVPPPPQPLAGRKDAPSLPAARLLVQAASMKLSSTFFDPAFSNSMSSLFPSIATTRP